MTKRQRVRPEQSFSLDRKSLSLRHVRDHAVPLLEGQLARDGIFGRGEIADAHAVPGALAW